jgi:hypothetical protein
MCTAIYCCSMLQQQCHHLCMALAGCIVQRSEAFVRGVICACAASQQQLHDPYVALKCSCEHPDQHETQHTENEQGAEWQCQSYSMMCAHAKWLSAALCRQCAAAPQAA